jgi:molecular chaperone DnaK (HSP70)
VTKVRIGLDIGSSAGRCAMSGSRGAQLVPDVDDAGTSETAPRVFELDHSAYVGEVVMDPAQANLLDAWQRHLLSDERPAVAKDPREVVVLGLALFIRKLMLDAAATSSDSIEEVVLAVPADWGPDAYACLDAAATIAGCKRFGIVRDSVAALSFHHQIDSEREGLSLVVDFGAEHAAITLVRILAGRVEILSRTIAADCGGAAFDATMERLVMAELARNGEANPAGTLAGQDWRAIARQLKHDLSQRPGGSVSRLALTSTGSMLISVTTGEFAAAVRPLLDKVLERARQVVSEHATERETLSAMVLVGGARWPAACARRFSPSRRSRPSFSVRRASCPATWWSAP